MVLAIISMSIFGLTHIIMSSIGVAQAANDYDRTFDEYGRLKYKRLAVSSHRTIILFSCTNVFK